MFSFRRSGTAVLVGFLVTLAGFSTARADDWSGDWAFAPSTAYPEFTALHVRHTGSGYSGTVTSKWYGDLPLLDLKETPGGLSFHLDNGNPKIAPSDIALIHVSQGLHMQGKLWYQAFSLDLHRASAAEVKALTFTATQLPPPRAVPENGLAMTPPMGWNSWNRFHKNIDDKTVREVADALVASGLRDAGYVYVNIDDGWQGKRAVDGTMQPNAKFPDMKALADYLHARGLKLGIYTSPGPRSCAGFEGSYGHISQDARTFARWGIDYLKYDLCSGEGFYHTAATVQATYQEMGEALRAAGRPVLYSLCEYGRFDVGAWGRSVGGNLWRTTGDIRDDYASMAAIGFDKNGVPNHTGPGGWNDPDMLEVGNGGMSDDEYRTHFSLWAMMAAPLILGNDLRSMTPQTLAIIGNREVIAIDQDASGHQGLPLVRTADYEVWTKPLSDGSTAVALFNRSAKAMTITADVPHAVAVHDLWSHTDRDPSAPLSADVPAHGVAMFRVK